MSGIDKAQIIHCTDMLFQRYCQKKYGINRGVYNTLELWFYNQGIIDIRFRRHIILEFMEYLSRRQEQAMNAKGTVKFGNGGLVQTLDHFWNDEGRKIVQYSGSPEAK
jgi:hypothetical protein